MFTLRNPLLIISALFLFSIGCQQPCPEYEVPEGYRLVKIRTNTTTTISQKTAVDWTSDWRAKMASSNGGFLATDPIKAFTIPHQDIAGVITTDSARAYLGIDSLNAYHLVIVGVDSTGADDLNAFYDLTLPCPDVCDQRSPLNQ